MPASEELLRLDRRGHGFTLRSPGHGDWLGPGRATDGGEVITAPHGDNSVIGRSERIEIRVAPLDGGAGLVLELEATTDLSASTGSFAEVGCGVHFDPAGRDDPDDDVRAFAHQYTEFALPTQASGTLDRWFVLPIRPSVVAPLWLTRPSGTPGPSTLLLAPLDTFHEQVVSVAPGAAPGIAWGWHGDLAHVPAGFTSRLAVIVGDSPRTLLDRWVGMLDVVARLDVDADTLGRQVSYWTDNGAAYWYRTEPPRSVTETLVDAVASVEEVGVPVGAVQLDSWFYPHEMTRPFDTDEWVVPPSGLHDWSPRADILPDGIEPLRNALADRPLVTHCRHLSRTSPLLEQFESWEGDAHAHPIGDDYYEEFLDRAARWGVETFEHDWLIECFLGVPGLRAAPGRARAWQEGIDRLAAARDMTLQWCMASPADLFQTATLGRVTSIRTSGDHGYLVGPGFLWAWFCYTNALARAFGLAPFKDVFASGGEHGEVEALLSALSTGPVGVGDAIGTTDAAVVLATCRADGTIVRPDVPIAAVDACYRDHAVARPVPLVAECHTDHDAGRWVQVFCANTFRGDTSVSGTVDLGPAWPDAPVVALDLRTGAVSRPGGGWPVELPPAAWTHHLLAPVLAGDLVVFGDVSKHAPVGRARIAAIAETDDGVRIDVAGEHEAVTISGWCADPVEARTGDVPLEVAHRSGGDAAGGDTAGGDTAGGHLWSVVVDAGTHLTVRRERQP